MNLFEKAVRNKFRFESAKGLLTVEQLFDLPLKTGAVNLNELAININKKLKDSKEESFVDTVSKEDQLLVDKLEILKTIISSKQEEAKAKADATKKQKEKQQLLEILERKRSQKLEDLSEEEILKRLAE